MNEWGMKIKNGLKIETEKKNEKMEKEIRKRRKQKEMAQIL